MIDAAVLGELNEREREVLRLLAAGHTVKSIAAMLARSEASINERLRDARRKTGVGSSRELARLLAAQEIRDRKIDLGGAQEAADSELRRGNRAAPRKGVFAMLLALPLAAAGAALLAAPDGPVMPPLNAAAAAHQAAPAIAGRWSLDVAGIPEGERPRAVTLSFQPQADGRWRMEVEIVAVDGVTQRASSIAAPDGRPVPIEGNLLAADSAALRRSGPNTLVLTLGKAGAPVSTRVYAVGRDQKTLTETIIWPGSDMPRLETTTFRRVG
ncbi:helix-turn-helix transcriptional regulator [Sphingomonas humi]|uniref:HTH luxR-type domain-containing protein n=1 Tax=Sphingomonas humi TaxID=335630 RepID=A0ABP7RKF2_9SPHN